MITNIRQLDLQSGKTIENNFQFLGDTFNFLDGKSIIFKDLSTNQNQLKIYQQNKLFYYSIYNPNTQTWGQGFELSPEIGFSQKTKFPLNDSSTSYIDMSSAICKIILQNQEKLKVESNSITISVDQLQVNSPSSLFNVKLDFQSKSFQLEDLNNQPQLTISKNTVNIHNKQLTGLSDCVSDQDAVNNRFLQQYVQTQLSNLSLDTVPLGVILPFYSQTVPTNYLLCNGDQFSQNVYPELFQFLGNSNHVPDLRGLFIRGFDSQGSVDPDGQSRQFGSVQLDQNKLHNHNYVDSTFLQTTTQETNSSWTQQISGSIGAGRNTQFVYRSPDGQITLNPTYVQTETSGGESRPKNISMNYVIKATNPHLGQGIVAQSGNLEMNGNSILGIKDLQMANNSSKIFTNHIQGVQSGSIQIHNPVQIFGYTGYQIPESGQLDSTGVSISGPKSINASLICEQDIVCNEINTLSSKTIKNILPDDNIVQTAIDLIKQIDFKKYEYIDKTQFGSGVYYGVIAEDIGKLIPNIVMDNKRYIPDIYQFAEVKLLDQEYLEFQFEKCLSEQFLTQQNDSIRVISESSMVNKSYCYICDLQVIEIQENKIITKLCEKCDKLKSSSQTFVYGSQQNCLGVAKERLFELGLIILQNLQNKFDSVESEQNSQLEQCLVKCSEEYKQQLQNITQQTNQSNSQVSDIHDALVDFQGTIALLAQKVSNLESENCELKQQIEDIHKKEQLYQCQTEMQKQVTEIYKQQTECSLREQQTLIQEQQQYIKACQEQQEQVKNDLKIVKQQLTNRSKDIETLQKQTQDFEQQISKQAKQLQVEEVKQIIIEPLLKEPAKKKRGRQ